MMGRTHAMTGTLAFLGASTLVPATVPELVLGTVVCTGAALIPDIDHPNSTITLTYGPVTRSFSWIFRALSGGHRMGTHSAMAVGLVFGSSWVAVHRLGARDWTGYVAMAGLGFLMVLAIAGAVRLLKIEGYVDDFIPIPLVIGLVWFTPVPLDLMPLALALGVAVHTLGDMLTMTGCPVGWPLSDRRYAFRLFSTGGFTENWLITPLTIGGVLALTGMRIF